MIEVELPDGRIVEFPDDMDRDVMKKALAGMDQVSGPGRLPAIAGSAAVRGLAHGMGAFGDLQGLIRSYVTNPLFGTPPDGDQSDQFSMPTSDDLTGLVNAGSRAIGGPTIVGNPRLKPTGEAERYLDAGIAGAASAISPLAVGGGLIPQMIAGTAGSLAATGVNDLLPNSGPALPLAASLVAGLVAGGGAEIAHRITTRRRVAHELAGAESGANVAADAQETARVGLAEAKRLAKTDLGATNSAADTAYNRALTGADSDLAAARTRIAADHTAQEDLGRAMIENVAATHGSAKTLEQAGTALQTEARNWLADTHPKLQTAVWAPVDSAIAGSTPGELFGFAQALKDIDRSAGGLEPLAKMLKPSIPSQLKKTFDDLFETPAGTPAGKPGVRDSAILDPYGNPVQVEIPGKPARSISWSDMQRLRTTLGDALANPTTLRDVGAQNLDRLYAALTGDMRGVAGNVGPEALTAFDAANEGSKRLFAVAEGPMAKVVASDVQTAEDRLPGAVAASLLRGGKLDAGDLAALREHIPGGVNELAAAALRTGGHSTLEDSAMAALIPDVKARGFVSAGDRALADAPISAKTALTTAQTIRDDLAAAAKTARDDMIKGQKAVNNALTQGRADEVEAARTTVFEAQKRLATAQEASKILAAKKTDPVDKLKNIFLGAETAAAVGVLAHHFIPNFTDFEGGALGQLVGIYGPMVAGGVGTALMGRRGNAALGGALVGGGAADLGGTAGR